MSCKIISGGDTKTKRIGWIHTDLSCTSSFFNNKKAEKKCYDNLSNVVCVSEYAKQIFINEVKSINEPIVIYNPIDKQQILRKSKENINCEIIKKRFTICGVGRLTKLKGFDRLIEVTGKLINEGYELDLWILGEGEYENKLKQQINKLCINDFVHLLGFTENPYIIMKQCDLYVCSSKFEGYSLTVAEAIILGLPVISTACTGPVELLNNGKYGLIVDNSTEGIYNGLKNVLDDDNLLVELKKKSQAREGFFSLNNTLSQVKNLLDSNEVE